MSRPGSLSLGWRAIRRRLLSQPATVLAIFGATLLAGTLLAAAPRLLEVAAAQDLEATVTDPDPEQRNVRVERTGRIGAGPADDPFLPVKRVGEAFQANEMPPSLSGVIARRLFVVDSTQFSVSPRPGDDPPHPFPTFLTFRYQEGVEEELTLLEGSMPTPQEPLFELVGSECPTDPEEVSTLRDLLTEGSEPDPAELDCTLAELPHLQVAVSAQTAEDMGVEIGRLMILQPDPRDPLVFGLSGEELGFNLAMSISGIVELSDPSREYWYGDESLHRPTIRETADFRDIFATGLISAEAYSAMLRATGEAARLYTWRHYVDPVLVAEADLDSLRSELPPFLLEFSISGARAGRARVITQLDSLLSDHVAQRAQTVGMLSVAVAGILTVVVAVIALLAMLMADRHRSADILMRSRGSSGAQMTTTGMYEGLLLAAPAGLIAYSAVAAIFAGTDHLTSYRVTVVLVGSVVAAIVVAGLGVYWGRLGPLQAPRPVIPRSGPRRVVLEIFTLTLAIGAVALLRRRGGVDDPSGTSNFDLLLAVTPAIVGLAAGMILLRLFPLLIRGLSWVGSRLPGPVLFVGFRRVLQQPISGRIPVVVILLCASTATYTAVLGTTIASGQESSSWQAVGADYTVKGPSADAAIPSEVDIAELGPFSASAEGRTFVNARVLTERATAPTEALTLNMPAYSEVIAGTQGDIALPSFLFDQPTPSSGSTESPIPAIVSPDWPGIDLEVGDVFTLGLFTANPTMVVREVRDRFPGIPERRSFVVFSLNQFESFSGGEARATVVFLRAGPEAEEQLAAGLERQSPNARLTSRYDYLSSLQEDPFIAWVTIALTGMFASSGLFAIVAAIASLAIAGARRRRDFGYLRTLGLEPRQAAWLTVIEQVPAVSIGTLVGVLIGLGTIQILGPAFHVDEFTGGLVPIQITANWPAIVLLGLGMAVALTTAIVIFVLVNRREQLSQILRIGDQP